MADSTKKIMITPEQIIQVERMAGLGMSVPKIALVIGVSKKTLERRLHDQPELADALEKGRALTSDKVRQAAYDMAISGNHPVMTIFWLKVREGWREKEGEERAPVAALPFEILRKKVA